MKEPTGVRSSAGLADRVGSILDSRGLTLSDVSRLSANRFGRWSAYYIPHNFYSALRDPSFTPRLQQVCALSSITTYRLQDWLLAFGFDIETIARLQAMLPAKRTLLIDTAAATTVSLGIEPRIGQAPQVTPLVQVVSFIDIQHSDSRAIASGDLMLIKVGSQDTFAYPEVYPGSVLFARRIPEGHWPALELGKTSTRLFLIEYRNGLICCRLHQSAKNRIVLVSKQLSYPYLELAPEDFRAVAQLEYEVRYLTVSSFPEVPPHFGQSPPDANGEQRSGGLLLAARRRAALSLREVSRRSQQIATMLGDRRYSLACGSLSQYESLDAPIRRIHKIVSLCILYGLPFSSFLRLVGFRETMDAGEPVPDRFVSRTTPFVRDLNDSADPWVPTMWTDPMLFRVILPRFLNGDWGASMDVPKPGINDLFWLDDAARNISPHLNNGAIAVVSRHRKTPIFYQDKSPWRQPLYVILHRDGTYECACCGRENGALLVRPCSVSVKPPRRLKSGIDAEVIGRIVTVIRRLP